mmetsp:Transcript_11545/g.37907  ORF Transcript_11545/g.37907 Transcript_11545/m.37907 type:complete len:373 (+) Transcript_11545:5141-6259(+)
MSIAFVARSSPLRARAPSRGAFRRSDVVEEDVLRHARVRGVDEEVRLGRERAAPRRLVHERLVHEAHAADALERAGEVVPALVAYGPGVRDVGVAELEHSVEEALGGGEARVGAHRAGAELDEDDWRRALLEQGFGALDDPSFPAAGAYPQHRHLRFGRDELVERLRSVRRDDARRGRGGGARVEERLLPARAVPRVAKLRGGPPDGRLSRPQVRLEPVVRDGAPQERRLLRSALESLHEVAPRGCRERKKTNPSADVHERARVAVAPAERPRERFRHARRPRGGHARLPRSPARERRAHISGEVEREHHWTSRAATAAAAFSTSASSSASTSTAPALLVTTSTAIKFVGGGRHRLHRRAPVTAAPLQPSNY